MKFTLGFLLIFVLSDSLLAYSKKIIFSSFETQQKAQKYFDAFESKGKKYDALLKLAKEKDFKVYVRKSGRYHIIVAEPFTDKNTLYRVMKIAKMNFTHPYVNKYSSPKKVQAIQEKPVKIEPVVIEKIDENVTNESNATKINKRSLEFQEIVVKRPIIEELESNETIQELKPPVTQERVLESNATESQVVAPQESQELDLWMLFKWLLLFVVVGTMIFYFIKFKRIYDEY